jgi:hypothetical protein
MADNNLPAGAIIQGHQADPVQEQASQRGTFDGQTFLADNGLTLNGGGANPGEVRVTDSYGNPATLNMNKIIGQSGANPNDYDVVMNTPDTAVNTSPVGFGDRIRLALGNAKGQINYLKANYQDATMKDGDLYVKDKGVWHTVDARGLGDGNGWDVAKELGGDIADLTKDAIVGAGQVIGAGVGAAEGGLGAIPGAAIGAGVASAGTAALGRILGTYDDTPEGMIKDVALDSFLGFAGEGVALGAKEAIVPTLSKVFSKLSAPEVSGQVKSKIAGYMKTLTGIPDTDTMTALTYGDEVGAKVQSLIERANKPQTLGDAGTMFDDAVDTGLAPGSDEAIMHEARKDTIGAATKLIGSDGGADSAQARLSAGYRSRAEDIANSIPKNQFVDVATPLAESVQDMQTKLAPLKILTQVVDEEGGHVAYKVADPATVGAALGISPGEAIGVGKGLQDYMNGAMNLIGKNKDNYGPEGMNNLFDAIKKNNDLYYGIVQDNPGLESLFGGSTKKLQNGLKAAANFDTDIMGRDGQMLNASQMISDHAAWYSEKMPAVKAAGQAAKSTQATEAMINKFFHDPSRNLAGKDNFAVLAGLMGETKEEASAAYRALKVAGAAQSYARVVPKVNPIGSLPRQLMAPNPRRMLGAMNVGVKGLSAMGSMMRRMPSATRAMTLASPDAFGAMLSTGTANLIGQ